MATEKGKKQKPLWWRVLHGQVINSGFFAKHWLITLVVIVMILICITNKYHCQTRIEKIKNLEQELETVKTECIHERSYYMGSIRESSMQQRIDTLHLNLQVQERPPFKLNTSKK